MNNIFSTIGLMYRAKKLTFGLENIEAMMKKNKISLILVGTSTSLKTQKKIQHKASVYNVDIVIVEEDKDTIAKSIGKSNVKVIGVNDFGFGKKIKEVAKGE